jgi:hypothetical protein
VVVAIREALRSVNPELMLGVAAYLEYTEIPEKTPLPGDILLDFCPILREYEHRIDEVTSPLNRNTYWEKFIQWHDIWRGRIQIYEYYLKYRFRSYPLVLPHLIAEELNLYHEVGVHGISSYSEPDTWLTYELSHKMISCFSFRSDVNADSEVRIWAEARVGPPAAKKLIEVVEILEGSLRSLYSADYGFHPACLGVGTEKFQDAMALHQLRLREALKILMEIQAMLRGARKAWVTHMIRSVRYAIADMGMQLAWGSKTRSLGDSLDEYQESLAGTNEDFSGVLHVTSKESRGDLASHYRGESLQPHW